MSERDMFEIEKEMIADTVVSYEMRVIANTPIWVIEKEIGILMPVFGELPINVQYRLIRQNEELNAFHEQIDNIREHLDRTPI
tara:strand:- start:109 stop:357 length:249 start_codon:yes stop_codon:yes gene_type:complete